MVESVNLAQSLIEKLLRLRIVGRYWVLQVAITLHQSRERRLRVSRVVLCGANAAKK